MITIFVDFCQFSKKKLAFFSKTNVTIKFLQKVTEVWAINANMFAQLFGENIFFNQNIGPRTKQNFDGFENRSLPVNPFFLPPTAELNLNQVFRKLNTKALFLSCCCC
jgi:hypothetical protein